MKIHSASFWNERGQYIQLAISNTEPHFYQKPWELELGGKYIYKESLKNSNRNIGFPMYIMHILAFI